jgi:hypothetical protein
MDAKQPVVTMMGCFLLKVVVQLLIKVLLHSFIVAKYSSLFHTNDTGFCFFLFELFVSIFLLLLCWTKNNKR